MTDTYTKIVLTVIAAALCANVLKDITLVNPAFAARDQIQKITICDTNGVCLGRVIPHVAFP
jgi:hypothetical protein